jgi:two-component system, OmpR family, sensor histidine kinase ChvG
VRSRAAFRRRWVSRLTLRILAVNLIALATLAGGVLYLDSFRIKLIEQRREELMQQAHQMAVALGELTSGQPEAPEIEVLRSAVLVKRLNDDDRQRARLFRSNGQQISDTLDENSVPHLAPLPRLNGWDWKSLRRRSARFLDRAIEAIGDSPELETYREPQLITSKDFPELALALNGTASGKLRRTEDGVVIISVAAPVQPYKRVAGALLLTADTRDIITTWRRERLNSFYVFLLALSLTLLLSIFLSRTIARPLQRLSIAAERVRLGRGREVAIPRYRDRKDEIGDLAFSLEQMTQALHTRMDAIEAFAADVSHELKNPLTSLRSAIDVFRTTKDPALREKLLDVVQDDIARLDRLITDISDASRLDAELSRAQMAPLDLRLMVSTLMDLYRTTKIRHSAKIKFVPPQTAMPVQGLELRLGQVVRNLVDNALSFSPDGGTVKLNLSRLGAMITLTVDDDGPGVPPDNLDDIFMRFYSERPAEESFGKHSGLGLSISRDIIEAHGGTIRVENRLSGSGAVAGARFIVELPAA